MVDFFVYDLVFLFLFVIGVFYFIKKHKKTLDREGWIYMYRTQWAVNFINYIGKKYEKILSKLRYLIVVIGYFLMAGILYLFGTTVVRYIKEPWISDIIKAPPVAPLIPYFPKLFGMENYFPSFYFTYFLIAIAVVAFVHEFSHGIFMKFSKIKIKSTGIIFLGPILGAFVEEDKKSFDGKGKFNRLSVLGAGVFANLITGIIFFFLAWGLFNVSYVSEGYIVTDYVYEILPTDSILGVENYSDDLVLVNTTKGEYFGIKGWDFQEGGLVKLYFDSPAIRNKLRGNIIEFNGEKVNGRDNFYSSFNDFKIGETIEIKMLDNDQISEYSLELVEHPHNSSKSFLGIVGRGLDPKENLKEFSLYTLLFHLKGSAIDYQPIYSFFGFIFNLLWWIMIINFLVALFNMLPLGILDGGQFFYVTILAITKNERLSKKIYSLLGRIIFLAFVLLMFVWAYRLAF
jgi:membrane-associated protease RseP (regulator of RpoE activity)